jgi:outer membrane murein-binding lipoprotein Lpp
MTPFPFDTLGASKQLREAGMPEGMAEAVVSVFQHAAMTVDINHLATKDDVSALRSGVDALRSGVDALRSDVDALRSDVDALRVSAKADIEAVRGEMATKLALEGLKADFHDKLRQQSWTMLGGMAVLLAITTGAAKLLG